MAREVRHDPVRVEREDGELRRGPPDEAVDQEEILGLFGGERLGSLLRRAAQRQAGFDLEPRAPSRRQRADGSNRAPADEEGPMPARVDGGREQAEAPATKRFQPPQPVDDVLERLDPVSQPRRLLVAQALREVLEPLA